MLRVYYYLLFAQSLFTDDRAVFLETFQYVLVGHGVWHTRQRQDYGARASVHQQNRHVTDPERRVKRPFQALGVGERHVTSVVRQAHRSQLVPELGILYGIDHFIHLRTSYHIIFYENTK